METAFQRYESVDLHVTEAGRGQFFLVASSFKPSDAGNAAHHAYNAIGELLRERGAKVVHERIFGSFGAKSRVLDARKGAFQERDLSRDGALTYIQGHPCWGLGFAGTVIQAVAPLEPGDDVWTIENGGLPCGRGWKRKDAAFLVLQNLQGVTEDPDGGAARSRQASRMIERAEGILRREGSGFPKVIRTWFYLSRILEWYGEFNGVRNTLYETYGLMPGSKEDRLRLPASTGIEGDTTGGSACVLDLLAWAGPGDGREHVRQLSNPAQEDAFRYGSSFSRGALIREFDVLLIHVSGTAAIDESGASLYPGDAGKQIQCTLDKIQALLAQEGAGLMDICAATIFVKRPEDAIIYRKEVDARGIEGIPGICMKADICRDELLFEMDAVAALSRGIR